MCKSEVGSLKSATADRLQTSGLRRYEACAFRCGFCLRCGCCGGGADVIAGACAAARVGALPRHRLTIAAAMKTLEYVPVMMPTTIVKAKPWSTSPPKKNNASDVRSAVPDVMTVRPSV